MLQTQQSDVELSGAIAAGICMVLLWADIFNLGQRYDPGQLMSAALVGGPILGLLFFILSSLITRALSTGLRRRSLPASAIFAWNSKIMRTWVFVALWLLLPYFILAQPVFAPGGSPMLLLWLLPTLPCICFFAYHSVLPPRVGWGLHWGFGVAIVAIAWAVTLGILLFLLSTLSGVSLT
jgi:hypothetical protein